MDLRLSQTPGTGPALAPADPLLREVPVDGPSIAALQALIAGVRARFGDATLGVLGYGSLLRDGLDRTQGIFDLLVVVDGYRRAYGGFGLAALNALLPPNVFYLEADSGTERVRAKYATISLAQLRRLTRPGRIQNWFWGRLAQPVLLAYARDRQAEGELRHVLWQSVRTFAGATAPLLGTPFGSDDLWRRGLEACFRTEFRPEGRERARILAVRDGDRYAAATRAVAADLGWTVVPGEDGVDRFRSLSTALDRGGARFVWRVRQLQGRVLQVLRLAKGALTFTGGLDYLAWKIERHSGVRVEVSERARRHPLLFGWWTLWKLRRRGGFR